MTKVPKMLTKEELTALRVAQGYPAKIKDVKALQKTAEQLAAEQERKES